MELEYISEYVYSIYFSLWDQVLAIELSPAFHETPTIGHIIHALTYNQIQTFSHMYSDTYSFTQVIKRLKEEIQKQSKRQK